MNQFKYVLITALFILGVACSLIHSKAADALPQHIQHYEYATIHWDGRDNTHIIRPSGQVEFVRAELEKVKKPNHTDDRAFYMNIVMNGLAKEGYEFAGISNDDIVMKRVVNFLR